METDGGDSKVLASCTGTAGENESCGWSASVDFRGRGDSPEVSVLTPAA